jgi:hypothetical protein
MRNDTSIAQLKRYLVGVLNTGAAENINEVLWVDGTSGNDSNDGKAPDRAFATIAGATAVAVAYDTIAVFPGSYTEHVALATANVSLVGLGDSPRQVVLQDSTDSTVEIIAITGSNVTVANVMVGNGHANNVEGITIGACDHVTIENCVIEPASGITQDEGIRIMGPSTNIKHVIRNCEFDTCTLGIVFEDSTTNALDVTIEGCTFRNGVTADITDSADIAVNGVLIKDCAFIDTPTDFIVLDNAGSTGLLCGCYFASATLALATIAVDAGVFTVGCYTEEGVNAVHPD